MYTRWGTTVPLSLAYTTQSLVYSVHMRHQLHKSYIDTPMTTIIRFYPYPGERLVRFVLGIDSRLDDRLSGEDQREGWS